MVNEITNLSLLILKALTVRKKLFEKLEHESTNAYRLFHGINEGYPGLTIDRYGSLIIIQTFREKLTNEAVNQMQELLLRQMELFFPGEVNSFIYNHRGKNKDTELLQVTASETHVFQEHGLKYIAKTRHRSLEPLLFLDMRAGRRFILNNSDGLSVLNLFAYTCGTGICALAGKAKEVWNIDFSSSILKIGKENAKLNNFSEPEFKIIKTDAFAALRQFNNIPHKGRGARQKPNIILPERKFDLVFLDPPAWAKSSFGTVDLIRDYQSIFKLSLLATSTGGRIVAVNNVAKVNLDEWLEKLKKCAVKAGRKIHEIRIIRPESDFPSPDRNYPLKIAVCDV